MSPEIALALDFSLSSDIFSFGIVLCEMMTCREPSEKFLHRRAQDMFALQENELRESIQKGCPEALIALALQCCDVEPNNRPTAQMCVNALEVLLNECMGGPEIEFIPIQPAKQQVRSHAFALVNGVREGHVHCPKTAMGNGRRIEDDDLGNRERKEGGFEARFALLEVQVQELRAENRRLNREMHAMMILYAELDRLFSSSPSLSRTSRHDGSSVSRRESFVARQIFSSGSSISRPPLDIRNSASGASNTSEGIGSKANSTAVLTNNSNNSTDRPLAGEIISAFINKPMDQEDESTRMKAAILGAAGTFTPPP